MSVAGGLCAYDTYAKSNLVCLYKMPKAVQKNPKQTNKKTLIFDELGCACVGILCASQFTGVQ